MSNDVIILVTQKAVNNEVGDISYQEICDEVFCEIATVGRSEFYQGMAKGLKPELLAILEDYGDYSGQKECIYNNVRYKVLKTFKPKNSSKLELTLYSGVFENGNAKKCSEI